MRPALLGPRAKGVPYVDTVHHLAQQVDAFAVLAPSTPETHLGLCEQVLPYAKPTFVDKTFASNAATAEQIFAMADKFAAPVQTTSALRTTNVQAEVSRLQQPLTSMAVWAGGASFGEYGIHPVELVVSCLGHVVRRMTVAGVDPHTTLVIEFEQGRMATIDFNAAEHVPFYAVLTTGSGAQPVAVDDSTLFVDAMAAILDFFEAGRSLVPRAQTLSIMRILDAARQARAREAWVDIRSPS